MAVPLFSMYPFKGAATSSTTHLKGPTPLCKPSFTWPGDRHSLSWRVSGLEAVGVWLVQLEHGKRQGLEQGETWGSGGSSGLSRELRSTGAIPGAWNSLHYRAPRQAPPMPSCMPRLRWQPPLLTQRLGGLPPNIQCSSTHLDVNIRK